MRYIPEFINRAYDNSPVCIRNLFATAYGILKASRERRGPFNKYFAELKRTENWSRDELDELQNRKLRKMIRHCADNVSYYRRIFPEYGIDPSQIRSKEDLSRLPVIPKEDILNNTDEFIADGYSKGKLLPESSSGTTGKPLTVYWDRDDYLWCIAAKYIVRERMGYDKSKGWLGIMNGHQILPMDKMSAPYWIKDYYNKTVHFSAYHISEDTIAEYHSCLERKSIRYILGYASVIGLVAKMMADRGLSLDVDAVMISSEPYYEWQIDSIKKAFDCKIINAFGQAERIALGSSCGETMNIHMFDEIGIVEFLKSDKHANRRMIATTLVNYAMPLIRYDLGDISDFAEAECSCGTEHTTILPVSTKSEDFIITPDNRYISASLLTFPFKHPAGIIESQLVQTEIDSLTVNLNVNDQFRAESEEEIRSGLERILGSNFRIAFNYTDHIPRTAMGKFRFVISKVKS